MNILFVIYVTIIERAKFMLGFSNDKPIANKSFNGIKPQRGITALSNCDDGSRKLKVVPNSCNKAAKERGPSKKR